MIRLLNPLRHLFPSFLPVGMFVWFACCASPASAQEKSLAEELTRLPPVEAAQALDTFHLEKGFSLELVASEPMVGDPVDACFDENGRMFVAEFHAYPYSKEKEKIIPAGTERTETGIIRMLEDTDGDGRMDRSTVFADRFDWPVSVAPYAGGIFVIDPPDVYYLKDTDGDGIADVREKVFTHLGRSNIQGIANNLKWGLDNRIWVASGSNGGTVSRRGENILTLGRSDWNFDPRTETVERATGGIQFGHSMDDWGNRFLCSNSSHIMHVAWSEKSLAKNPYSPPPTTVRQIAKEGGAAPVFRRSPLEPWRIVRTRRRNEDPKYQNLPATERVAGGFFTSAAGVTIYRGAAYPEEFRGNAFVGDVGSNLVHRKILTPSKATFEAVRADDNTEFVASTDTWFRPVNYVNAPDGTLFILDMYREVIEHPISIPNDIRALLDLESGNDRGRIYRLVSPEMRRFPVVRLGEVPLPKLVDNLAAENSWNRETAQRLLWERQLPESIPLVETLLKTTDSPLGRLHALYTLNGLSALTPEHLLLGLNDSHPGVQRHAIELSEPFLSDNQELSSRVIQLLSSQDYRVRMQAMLAISCLQRDEALTALLAAAELSDLDGDLQTAFLLSVGDRGADIIERMVSKPEFLKQKSSLALLKKIAEMVGARPERTAAESLLKIVTRLDQQAALRSELLINLDQGLTRSGSSLARLMQSLPENSETFAQLNLLFEQASQTALNEALPIAARRHALKLLAIAPWTTAAETLGSLLGPQVTSEIQVEVLQGLQRVQDPAVAGLLVSSWKGFTPGLRVAATDLFLRRVDWTESLLQALEQGQIQRSELDRLKFPSLLNHPQAAIRERSKKLLGDTGKSDRIQVVADYQPALELPGNPERGRAVFSAKCLTCHKLGNEGYQVGPDLTSVQNKTPTDLLVAILDPNRETQLNFTVFTVATQSGQIYTGMIAAESAGSLTLRGPQAKDEVILRSQIEELISSGQSLMPEGFEKEISHQEMSDLIAFIKSLKSSSVP